MPAIAIALPGSETVLAIWGRTIVEMQSLSDARLMHTLEPNGGEDDAQGASSFEAAHAGEGEAGG